MKERNKLFAEELTSKVFTYKDEKNELAHLFVYRYFYTHTYASAKMHNKIIKQYKHIILCYTR